MNRRNLIGLGLSCSAAGAAGVGFGYKFRDELRDAKARALSLPPPDNGPAPVVREFWQNASDITERHRLQTKETVQALKAKYESPILGKFRVWDLLQKLALCVDPTDTSLHCTSQYMHVCQILAGMEQDGVLDEKMLLIALIHDLGKVAMLAGEAPENVVCMVYPVEALEPGSGLDNVLFQFGHDEIAYSRFKDHVPEDVAWALRYHSMVLGEAEPYMSAADLANEKAILTTFRKYDQGTKSPANLPQHATLDRYRDFIEERFPNPILF